MKAAIQKILFLISFCFYLFLESCQESGQCSQRNFNKNFQNLIKFNIQLCVPNDDILTTKYQTEDAVIDQIEACDENDLVEKRDVITGVQENTNTSTKKTCYNFNAGSTVDIFEHAEKVGWEISRFRAKNGQICKNKTCEVNCNSSSSLFSSSHHHLVGRNANSSNVTLGNYNKCQRHSATNLFVTLGNYNKCQRHSATNLCILFFLVFLICIVGQKNIANKHTYLKEINALDLASLEKYISLLSGAKLNEMSNLFKHRSKVWSLDPRHSISASKLNYNFNTDIFAYPVFDLSRLASYRWQLGSFTSPVSYIQLSEAGFRYSGEGSLIVCDSCNKSVDLMSIEKNPNSSQFHNHGCEYVTQSESENTQSLISSEILSNGEVQITDEKLKQSEVDINEILNCDMDHYGWMISPQDCIDGQLFQTESFKQEEHDDISDCIKGYNHEIFRPINVLSCSDLPDKLKEENVFNLIKIFGHLTVKVENRERRIHGTGYIFDYQCKVISTKTLQQLPYLNKNNGELFNKFSELGIIYIQTTSHLFQSNTEHFSTEVVFSHENFGMEDLRLRGEVILGHKKKGVDQSIIVCFTSNLKVIEHINTYLQELMETVRKLPDNVKECMSERVFILSYPHGLDKALSFGKSTSKIYEIRTNEACENAQLFEIHFNKLATVCTVKNVRLAKTYDAPTCPGSSGAPVITFKTSSTSEWEIDVWTHEGTLSNNILKGVSVLKEFDDTIDTGFIIRALTSLSLAPPAYPTYYLFEKRSESLQNWSFPHILVPNVVAEAGFFYAGYADCVRCFQCGLGLRSWKMGDDINSEHARHRPTCSFLQMKLNSRALVENSEDSNPDNPCNQSIDNVSTLTSVKQVKLNQENKHIPLNTKTSVRSAHYAASKKIKMKLLQKENTMLKQLLKCKVCTEAPVKELFLPCGHLYACSECSKQLVRCPVCEEKILGTVTSYLT